MQKEIKIPGYERVVSFHEPKVNLKGFIAVHSTKLGPSLGGVRMRPYKNEEEGLQDVLHLSQAMTYKAAISNLASGGGKCAIFGNPHTDKTKELFIELGKVINTLKGQYIAAEDSGTNIVDMNLIQQSTEHVSGTTEEGNPSPTTGFGVFEGISTYVNILLEKPDLKDIKIAIQGIGGVGYALARHLKQVGAQLFVSDIYEPLLEQAQQELHATIIEPDQIVEQPVDIFAPCAYGSILNAENIAKLKCKIVAGAANNQFNEEQKAPYQLHQRGIWHAPDYVINAGGLINLFCKHHHLSKEELLQKISIIPKRLSEILTLAKKENQPPLIIANKMVERILSNA